MVSFEQSTFNNILALLEVLFAYRRLKNKFSSPYAQSMVYVDQTSGNNGNDGSNLSPLKTIEYLKNSPIDDISDIFSSRSAFFPKIKQVIDELETKIKHILKQRGILINYNKSAEKPSLDQEVRLNKQINQNQELTEDKDLGLLRLFSKIEAENQQKDEAIENLSEDEKLKRYRKIYGVLQQFINDENPNQ